MKKIIVLLSLIIYIYADDPLYIEYKHQRQKYVIPIIQVSYNEPPQKVYLQFANTRLKSEKPSPEETRWLRALAIEQEDMQLEQEKQEDMQPEQENVQFIDIYVFSNGNIDGFAPFNDDKSKRSLPHKIHYQQRDPYFYKQDNQYYCSYANSKIVYRADDPLILETVFAIQKGRDSQVKLPSLEGFDIYDLSMTTQEFAKQAQNTIFYFPGNPKMVISQTEDKKKIDRAAQLLAEETLLLHSSNYRNHIRKIFTLSNYQQHQEYQNYHWQQSRMIDRIYSIYEDNQESASIHTFASPQSQTAFLQQLLATPICICSEAVQQLIQSYDQANKIAIREEALNYLIDEDIHIAEKVAKSFMGYYWQKR